MSPASPTRAARDASFHRASEDEPAFMSEDSVSMGFSPHERG